MNIKTRNWQDYLVLLLKGMLMGAADIIPGVSGGTIAFITGIYEELLHSIRSVSFDTVRLLFKQGIQAAWQQINGHFLFALFSGILLSLITLSSVVLFLLERYPILLSAFFFGLIFASVWVVVRQIDNKSWLTISAFLVGAALAYWLTNITPSTISVTALTVFLSGCIAICAMILPGISGSFILLMLGMYSYMLSALKQFDWITIAMFGAGCLAGLLSFSRILSWMFSHHKSLMLSILGGIMLGSLNKVWPWKQAVETTLNEQGELIILTEQNLSPFVFEQVTQQSALLPISIVTVCIGMAIVLGATLFGKAQHNQNQSKDSQ
jgi:putative membrane protein